MSVESSLQSKHGLGLCLHSSVHAEIQCMLIVTAPCRYSDDGRQVVFDYPSSTWTGEREFLLASKAGVRAISREDAIKVRAPVSFLHRCEGL